MSVYKAKKGTLIKWVILMLMALPILVFFLDRQTFSERPFMLLLLLVPIVLIIWPYLDTQYQIDGQMFKYKSAYIKGEIEINKIRSILKGRTRWVGIKPALATGGMIIKYNRFDDVYVAPVSNEALIRGLLAINENIQVKRIGSSNENE